MLQLKEEQHQISNLRRWILEVAERMCASAFVWIIKTNILKRSGLIHIILKKVSRQKIAAYQLMYLT